MKVLSFLGFLIFYISTGFGQTAEDLYKQADGITGTSKNDLKQKTTLLTQAITLKSNFKEAFLLRAKTYEDQKAYKEAIADYSTLIALDSANALYFKYRAKTYRLKGEPEQAIADYTTAFNKDTSLIDCIYERGNLYNDFFVEKQAQKAIDDFNLCIKNGSLNIKSMAYVGRGHVQENLKQFDKALIDYNTALKVNPLNAEAYLYRGLIKMELNQDGCYDLLKYRDMNGIGAQDYLNRYCTK
jgi:tetratricopeptide (TPR) repeat protein